MIFNGYDFSQYWRVQRELSPIPPINVIERTIPGRPGTRFVRSEIEPMEIDVTMRLKLNVSMTDTTTLNYIKRLSGKALAATEPAELMFYEEPDIRYFAIVTDCSGFDTPVFTGAVDLTFHCCDPFGYYLFSRTKTLKEGVNTFEVAGSHEMFPIFHLKAKAGDEVKITNSDGMFVQCKGPFSDGDEIEIDFEKGFVYRNGILSQFSLTSTFFELFVGENEVTVEGASEGTITFAERSV